MGYIASLNQIPDKDLLKDLFKKLTGVCKKKKMTYLNNFDPEFCMPYI